MKKFIPFGALLFVVALALVFPSVKTVTIANPLKLAVGWIRRVTRVMRPGGILVIGTSECLDRVAQILIERSRHDAVE